MPRTFSERHWAQTMNNRPAHQTLTISLLKKHSCFVFIGTVVIFPLIYQQFGFSLSFIKGCLLSTFLLYISIIDWNYQLIFDRLLLPMLAVGLIFIYLQNEASFLLAVCCAIAYAGLLLTLRFLTDGGMGGGDIKLAFVLGIWLNFPQTLWAALSAFWLGGFWGLTILLKGTAQRYIAFGPFLAIGALLAFLFGTDLYAIYRSLFYV